MPGDAVLDFELSPAEPVDRQDRDPPRANRAIPAARTRRPAVLVRRPAVSRPGVRRPPQGHCRSGDAAGDEHRSGARDVPWRQGEPLARRAERADMEIRGEASASRLRAVRFGQRRAHGSTSTRRAVRRGPRRQCLKVSSPAPAVRWGDASSEISLRVGRCRRHVHGPAGDGRHPRDTRHPDGAARERVRLESRGHLRRRRHQYRAVRTDRSVRRIGHGPMGPAPRHPVRARPAGRVGRAHHAR